MNNSSMSHDIREIVDGVRGVISKGMSSMSMPQLMTPSEHELRLAVLSALAHGALSAKEVIDQIRRSSAGTFSPSHSQVHPLLERLAETSFVTTTVEGDAKKFELTDLGREELLKPPHPQSSGHKPAANHMGDKVQQANRWFEEHTGVLKAGAKLAQAVTAVSQHATSEQQQRAIEILDEARRKLYEILAEKN
jgi:DNA-binding PadR family transcriptional regulator